MPMKKMLSNTSLLVATVFGLSWAHVANAQEYRGAYTPQQESNAQSVEDTTPLPRIFSAQMDNKTAGEALDKVYNDLLQTLWIYARADFLVHKDLYKQLDNDKFKTTRYKEEFSKPLNKAMEQLNINNSEMTFFISEANKKFTTLKETLSAEDQEKVQYLWDSRFGELETYINKHFEYQNKFLNKYFALAKFILGTRGQYTYKSDVKKIVFYDYADYIVYGEKIDQLRKISFEQAQHIKTLVPSGINTSSIK